MPLNPDYKTLCNTVYEAEGILLSKELTEEKAINSVEVIALEIELIRKTLENLTLNGNSFFQSKEVEPPTTIAYVDTDPDRKNNLSLEYDPEQFNHAIKCQSRLDQANRFYTRKGRSPSADRSRSRDRSRSQLRNSRECDQSGNEENINPPFRDRSSRDIECYYCHSLGHRVKKCLLFRDDRRDDKIFCDQFNRSHN